MATLPAFGLDEAETETVAWLVRYHLLIRRPPSGAISPTPKPSRILSTQVQSPERLRLLLMLTVVDIRAVGPTTWNDWKRQLLRTLFDAAEERLRLGHKQRGRSEEVKDGRSGWLGRLVGRPGSPRPYPPAAGQLLARRTAAMAARQCPAGRAGRSAYRRGGAQRHSRGRTGCGATRISVFAPDRPGLFYRICAGLAAAGASIVDARIHTTRDGMALDNLLVQIRNARPMPTGAFVIGW